VEAFEITNDRFIRTTDPHHEKTVQKILKSSTTREIFTRVNMKAGIALLVSLLDEDTAG